MHQLICNPTQNRCQLNGNKLHKSVGEQTYLCYSKNHKSYTQLLKAHEMC